MYKSIGNFNKRVIVKHHCTKSIGKFPNKSYDRTNSDDTPCQNNIVL